MPAPLTRLADRLLIPGDHPCFDPIALSDVNRAIMQATLNDLIGALRLGAPVIVADNVAEYYYAGTDQEHWEIKTDFPVLIPPFPRFWIEWTQPSVIRSRVYGVNDAAQSSFTVTGVLVSVQRAVDFARYPPLNWQVRNLAHARRLAAGADWVWSFRPLAVLSGTLALVFNVPEAFAVPVGDYWVATTRDGALTQYLCTSLSDARAINGQDYVELLGHEAPLFIHPALLAVSFMNLRNGTLAPAAAHAPERFARNYARRHGRELVRYHTVVVDPNRTSKPSVPAVGSGRAMPIHLVRGVMVTYRDEDGHRLFGRYHGAFFRPPHVRGNAHEGVSVHDYRVKSTIAKEYANDESRRD